MDLYLSQGSTIIAADSPKPGETTGYMGGTYDAAEPKTTYDAYQDYGHNHWHNSLIWGENINDFSITGPGLIWGKGLSFGAGPGRPPAAAGATGAGFGPERPAGAAAPGAAGAAGGSGRGAAGGGGFGDPRPGRGNYPQYQAEQPGVGNKAIALKNCRNVTLPRLLHPQRRPLRPSAHGRRQPHHRQPQDRHRPRWHGHRLLQERPRLELHR